MIELAVFYIKRDIANSFSDCATFADAVVLHKDDIGHLVDELIQPLKKSIRSQVLSVLTNDICTIKRRYLPNAV